MGISYEQNEISSERPCRSIYNDEAVLVGSRTCELGNESTTVYLRKSVKRSILFRGLIYNKFK